MSLTNHIYETCKVQTITSKKGDDWVFFSTSYFYFRPTNVLVESLNNNVALFRSMCDANFSIIKFKRLLSQLLNDRFVINQIEVPDHQRNIVSMNKFNDKMKLAEIFTMPRLSGIKTVIVTLPLRLPLRPKESVLQIEHAIDGALRKIASDVDNVLNIHYGGL